MKKGKFDYFRNKLFDHDNFISSAINTAKKGAYHNHNVYLLEKLNYKFPGYGTHILLEAMMGQTEDYRFALSAKIWKDERMKYSNLTREETELFLKYEKKRDILSKQLHKMEKKKDYWASDDYQSKKSWYESYRDSTDRIISDGRDSKTYNCTFNIKILPVRNQEPRFIREYDLQTVQLCSEGPVRKLDVSYSSGFCYIRKFKDPAKCEYGSSALNQIIDPDRLHIRELDAKSIDDLVVVSHSSFDGKKHKIDLAGEYKRMDAEHLDKITIPNRNLLGRITVKLLKPAFETGTIAGFENYINDRLEDEKVSIYDKRLLRIGLNRSQLLGDPTKEKKSSSSSYRSSGSGFYDGDGCYRSAAGWGGHSAG